MQLRLRANARGICSSNAARSPVTKNKVTNRNNQLGTHSKASPYWGRRHSQPRCIVLAEKKEDDYPAISPAKSFDGQQPPGNWQWIESKDALKAYGAFGGILTLGTLPNLQSTGAALIDLPYFVGLAAATIYIGAHRGLGSKQRQTLSLKQGALAPLFASAALLGAYIVIKFFPLLSLATFFDCYFALIGCIAILGASVPLLRRLGSDTPQNTFRVDLPPWVASDAAGDPLTHVDLSVTDFLAVAFALAVSTADFSSHHTIFTLNNLIACAITTDILQLIGPRSFKVAGLLLSGLLVYDVVWVFLSPFFAGGNVMLTVATSDIFSGPTRLLFPRPLSSIGEASDFPFSLLGLGDIAVPGLLACLALRFDASRSCDMAARAEAAGLALQSSLDSMDSPTDHEATKAAAVAAEEAFDLVADAQEADRLGGGALQSANASVLSSRPYFAASMVSYVFGLGLAFAANAITHMGQPALLYIVPSMLGAVALTASARGEVKSLLRFTDKSSLKKEGAPKS